MSHDINLTRRKIGKLPVTHSNLINHITWTHKNRKHNIKEQWSCRIPLWSCRLVHQYRVMHAQLIVEINVQLKRRLYLICIKMLHFPVHSYYPDEFLSNPILCRAVQDRHFKIPFTIFKQNVSTTKLIMPYQKTLLLTRVAI